MALLEAKSVAEFDTILNDGAGKVLVVHFWADWAPQCQQITDVLDELAKDAQYSNCGFVKNNKEVDRVNGANVPELTKKVGKHASAQPAVLPQQNLEFQFCPDHRRKHITCEAGDCAVHTYSVTAASSFMGKLQLFSYEDLNTRLKKLINSAPVMLFMKGIPDEPRCGFSRTITGLLAEHNVEYSSFNILADEEVRQGLKTFSNWPTYPQLYVNGELLGGLDIVKELIASGEFDAMVPKKKKLEDRLKELINQEKVMLFMKGSPETPRCGFSKTITQILNETGLKYSTFDILQDEEVRQGLKKFSNWPTYPQLYVKGELIGGLDIVKELLESGELKSTIEGQ